jgi:hypothetical protein
MVTLVINSCGRLDLLERSIASFEQYNTFPITETILVDDSGDENIHKQIREKYSRFTLVLEPHRGLVPCVDAAFSRVKTQYMFKTEDDWEFYRSGFIERSIEILELLPDVMHVWLRERNDTNGHPVEPGIKNAGSVPYYVISQGFLGTWHGFTFNPSLWRKSDYDIFAPFVNIAGSGNMGTQEMNIGEWYYRIGKRAVILHSGYVKHIGWGRRSYAVE